MFTQLLGAAATVYRVLGALNKLLQARQMHARRTSRESRHASWPPMPAVTRFGWPTGQRVHPDRRRPGLQVSAGSRNRGRRARSAPEAIRQPGRQWPRPRRTITPIPMH